MAAGLLSLLPEALMAQPPATSVPVSAGTARSCDMSAHAVVIRLLDASTGAALTDAKVTVWRAGADAPLREATLLPLMDGRWVLLEDGQLAIDQPTATVPLVVQVERAGRELVRREVRVGLDAGGCHLVLRGSVTELRV